MKNEKKVSKKYFNKSDIDNTKYTYFYLIDYLLKEYKGGNEQYFRMLISDIRKECSIHNITSNYIHNYNLTESDIDLINNRTIKKHK